MFGQRVHKASAQRIENQTIGYRMHESARDRAYSGECFQSVAGDREA